MILLETIRKMFIWLSIYPVDTTHPKIERLQIRIFSLIIFIAASMSVVTSFAAALEFIISEDLENVLYTIAQVAGIGSGFYYYIIGLILRKKMTHLFNQYQKIFEECKWNAKPDFSSI